jgi:putative DNA primase/helicase
MKSPQKIDDDHGVVFPRRTHARGTPMPGLVIRPPADRSPPINELPPSSPAANPPFGSFDSSRGKGFLEIEWPEPAPLPDALPPVAPFDMAFLPEAIGPWVLDISDRMQCPPDYVGIPATVAMGSLIGRRVGVRPQAKTDWIEVGNLWGCIVGRPGMLKSPAMREALKPLNRIEAKAREANDEVRSDYEARLDLYKIQKEEAQKQARKSKSTDPACLRLNQPEEPAARRYIVNDATYEALGVILAGNPNGTLAFRDELISLLKTLDKEENAAARGFFLTAWNGTDGYSFDRIMRGKTHIDAACLSLLGSTQPGRLAEYMARAAAGGAGDDGMIQRFSLLVWPDQSPEWKDADRYPDSVARETAWRVFDRLSEMTAESIGAQTDGFETIPFLRFDGDALGVFQEWRAGLERQLRSGDLSPALESHLAKYRTLVPTVALINHLADGGVGEIAEPALLRSLAFADYLETHARRAYRSGSEVGTASAKAILGKIVRGELQDGFTARDVHRPRWSNLSDKSQVDAGLALLVDCDWLAATQQVTGGRPTIAYLINPRGAK